MKKVVLVLLAMVLGLLALPILVTAEDAPDDMQQQYCSRYSQINRDLQILQMKKSLNEKIYSRRIKVYSLYSREIRETKEEGEQISKQIDQNENRKEDLKLDALKYYKGKLPTWLGKCWEESEKKYQEKLTEIRSKK